MARWIHDHLPNSKLQFFPKLLAVNIAWSEAQIWSYVVPRGVLTKPGMPGHEGNHSDHYQGFPSLVEPGRVCEPARAHE